MDTTGTACNPGPIEYPGQIDTALEFQKPLGTGTNIWPATPVNYPNYATSCLNLDNLKVWWSNTANRDAFAHVSHTFTHEDQDNATYYDVFNEISWNQAWMSAVGIASASKFSPNGLIPPAITVCRVLYDFGPELIDSRVYITEMLSVPGLLEG